MSYNMHEPKKGLYEFDNKHDFVEYYEDHKESINQDLSNGLLEVKFLDDVGDALVSAEPTNEGGIEEDLKILPDNIKVHLIKKN